MERWRSKPFYLADLFLRHAEVEFMRYRIADFDLRHHRLVLAILGNEQPPFLKNSSHPTDRLPVGPLSTTIRLP